MHKSNKSEKERKEASPFSKEFYKKRGLSEEDRKKFIDNALEGREFDTRPEYWIKRGYTEKEAKKIITKRQTTFSLKICIEKYGEEHGLERWKKRQKNWKSKVFNNETYIGGGDSELSSFIISEIVNRTGLAFLYGDNEKFIYDSENKRAYKYDLTYLANKKIIEINGIFWHCKPELYESHYFHKIMKKTAKEIWEYDRIKKELAEKYGYKIFYIWEDDFHNDPEGELKKCIDFLYEENT